MNVAAYVDDRAEQGIFRIDRSIYNDPGILEAEYERIFESGWLFLCHEAHIPSLGDYFTTHMGRQPVFVIRAEDGGIAGFLNACGHRGALLVPGRAGNARTLVCPYHSFCFNTKGRCISVKNREQGWPETDFDIARFDLRPIARVECYRGFVFGSLSPDVGELRQHLGAATALIDIFAAPAPQALEVVGGYCVYTSSCNWKIMHENGPDAYHAAVVHRNFAETMAFREARGGYDGLRKTEESGRTTGLVQSASYDLGDGHTSFWTKRSAPETYPIYAQRHELAKRFSPAQLEWIIGRGRHCTVFPNLLLNDLASSHLRVYRPLSVDRTETMIWCMAPVGEAPEVRAARLRKFEDFFLPSGMATPDDVAIVEAAHKASWALESRWTGMTRGMAFRVEGPDEAARALGFTPRASTNSWDHEIALQGVYRQWLKLMAQKPPARRG